MIRFSCSVVTVMDRGWRCPRDIPQSGRQTAKVVALLLQQELNSN